MVTLLIWLIACLISLLGWFVFHSVKMVFIGVLITLIRTLCNVIRNHIGVIQTIKALFHYAGYLIPGALICFFFAKNTPWYVGSMLSYAILSPINLIYGLGALKLLNHLDIDLDDLDD